MRDLGSLHRVNTRNINFFFLYYKSLCGELRRRTKFITNLIYENDSKKKKYKCNNKK